MRKTLKYLVGILIVVSVPAIFLLASRFKPVIRQPIAFPHKVHVANQIECVYCHDSAERSTEAGIPSVTQCMDCHRSTKTDSPEIQKLAAFAERHEEVPWVRIYSFPAEAAVYFSHKRHLKAGIQCDVCHGQVAEAVEMRREIHWTMGKCIDCHKSKQASIGCLTCHK